MKTINDEDFSRVRSTVEITLAAFGALLLASSVLYFLYLTRAVLMYFIVALIISAALAPVVASMQKSYFNRIWSSVLALLSTILIIVGIIGAIATPLFTQGVKLLENAPEILNTIISNPNLSGLNQRFHLTERAQDLSNQSLSKIAGGSSSALGFAGTVFGDFTALVVTFIFAFFILVDGPKAWAKFLAYWDEDQAEKFDIVGKKMLRSISGFVTGNLFISLIAAVVTLALLLILQVPYAFALAALVALFDLIPMIGAAIATIVVGLVALTKGVTVAAIVISVLLAYQFIEGHFIQPAVYSRSVELSALVIIIATVVGAELMGVTGVLLAIPTASVIQILLVEFVMRKKPVSKTH
ncbi:MAG: AI-2E family transporter [Candidatus Doudnabacteria bacterium]